MFLLLIFGKVNIAFMGNKWYDYGEVWKKGLIIINKLIFVFIN